MSTHEELKAEIAMALKIYFSNAGGRPTIWAEQAAKNIVDVVLTREFSERDRKLKIAEEALQEPCPSCSAIGDKYPGIFVSYETCSKCQACSKALSQIRQ